MLRLKVYNGSTAYEVSGRFIRDTGTGVIIDDDQGIRWFAPTRNVIKGAVADLFAPIENV